MRDAGVTRMPPGIRQGRAPGAGLPGAGPGIRAFDDIPACITGQLGVFWKKGHKKGVLP